MTKTKTKSTQSKSKTAAKKAAVLRRNRRMHLGWLVTVAVLVVATGYHVFAERNPGLSLRAPAGTTAREAELQTVETTANDVVRASYDRSIQDNANFDQAALGAFTEGRHD